LFVRKLELASLQEELKNTLRELGSQMDNNQVMQLEKMFGSSAGSSPGGPSPAVNVHSGNAVLMLNDENQENYQKN
jgi:hypothetical protein